MDKGTPMAVAQIAAVELEYAQGLIGGHRDPQTESWLARAAQLEAAALHVAVYGPLDTKPRRDKTLQQYLRRHKLALGFRALAARVLAAQAARDGR